jgi:uncharacterized protein (DUF1778 family)
MRTMKLLRTQRLRRHSTAMGKRELLITVRLSAEDMELLQKAARRLWRDAPITRSTMLLALAMQRARDVLRLKKAKQQSE